MKYSHIINKTFLFSGKDLKIFENMTVKHPTVEEIMNINEGIGSSSIYFSMVYGLICDPYENMVMLDDMGVDYETVDCFDVFLIKWDKLKEEYYNQQEMYDSLRINPLDGIKQSLCFFIGDRNYEIKEVYLNNGSVEKCIIDLDDVDNGNCKFAITRNTFNLISEFLFLMNDFDKSDRINPANKHTKKLLIEDMRDELKRKQRRIKNDQDEDIINDYIGNMCISLGFGGNGSLSIFDVEKLKIYQLISGFKKTIKREKVNNLMRGIYAGTIDPKTINDKELDWIN